MRRLTRNLPWLALAVALCASGSVSAGQFKLVDGNSVVEVDTSSQTGMGYWAVNGLPQLAKQWFWFRAAGDTSEHSLDTLPISFEGTQDSNSFPGPERLFVVYYDPQERFEISLDLLLGGGSVGSPNSTLVEAIRIHNLQRTPLDLTFFQYVDFDLGGTPGGDTGELANANTIVQSAGALNVAESVVTPKASHYQVDLFPTILNSLNNGSITNLNDNGGPVSGDVSWSFQWDMTLPADGTFLISKIKTLTVPEPQPFVLAALGLLGAGVMAWRRRSP